jgi:hypothetical protein
MTLATADSFACAAVNRTSDDNGHSTASANEPLALRQAPHNLEAEQALLGAILVNNDALDWVSGFVSPDHFFDPLHGRIYETALKLRCEGRPVTPTILKTFFEDAEPVKPGMTVPQYLGHLARTFNKKERDLIEGTPALRRMTSSPPAAWAGILQAWRDAEAKRIASRCLSLDDDDDGMRRQALHDLHTITVEFAGLTDGRRQKLFSLACRVARYVVHGKLSENEFRSALMDAARANGALAKHGPAWAVTTIRSAINRASKDPLPPLARAFRSEESHI